MSSEFSLHPQRSKSQTQRVFLERFRRSKSLAAKKSHRTEGGDLAAMSIFSIICSKRKSSPLATSARNAERNAESRGGRREGETLHPGRVSYTTVSVRYSYTFPLTHLKRADSCVLVCLYVFIKMHITAQSGAVILVILCHSH